MDYFGNVTQELASFHEEAVTTAGHSQRSENLERLLKSLCLQSNDKPSVEIKQLIVA